MAEFGHLQGGGIFRSCQRRRGHLVGVQFHLLRFQCGRYRGQGGFGSARIIERILLTSGVGGLAATTVMSVRSADCVMLLRR